MNNWDRAILEYASWCWTVRMLHLNNQVRHLTECQESGLGQWGVLIGGTLPLRILRHLDEEMAMSFH